MECGSRFSKTADLSTTLRSGRDDKLVVSKKAVSPVGTGPFALNKFVISTGEACAFGPPMVIKNNLNSATSHPGSAALPFVISTEAKRSGEISVLRLFHGDVFDRAYPDFLLHRCKQ
jgi:hypothetical protein